MKKTLILAISLPSFLAVHLNFALKVGDAQPLPAACTSSAIPPTPQNNPFLTGPEFLDNGSMTLDGIRNYLRAIGSWLKGDPKGMILDTDGVMFDFAQTLFDAAADPIMQSGVSKKPINPQLLLATIQKESRMLFRRTRPIQVDFHWLTLLTGCGNPSIMRGPSGQIQCAARSLRNRFEELAACQDTSTKRVWHLGTTTSAQDGIMVTPANASTGANFAYTPVAGVQWGGNIPDKGGVALFCILWNNPDNRGGTGFANPPVNLTLGPNNPTLTCSDPLSDSLGPPNRRNVTLSVSGGTRPYTWTVTWPTSTLGTFQVCPTANGEDAVLKPPANPGAKDFPGQIAYIRVGTHLNWFFSCFGSSRGFDRQDFDCDDGAFGACQNNAFGIVGNTQVNCCENHGQIDCIPPGGPICYPPNQQGTCGEIFMGVCDKRSPQMISGRCNPCVGVMTGTTITVRDNAGASITRPITVR